MFQQLDFQVQDVEINDSDRRFQPQRPFLASKSLFGYICCLYRRSLSLSQQLSCVTISHGFTEFNLFKIYTGKRSEESMTPLDATINNIPLEQFDLDAYLAFSPLRMRRSCHGDNDPRYVLFIMDTSGSIGSTDFDAAKQAVAVIANSLCGYSKVALMSFSTARYLDFCFDCYPDEGQPRTAIRNAIMNTPYRGGSTYTADAIKCACEHMLSPTCGPPLGNRTNNIDVVILTDGFNNGPCQSKLLEVAKCLKDEDTINIFAIAIGGGSAQTVANLVKHPDYTHIFQVKDFTQLGQLATAAERAAAGGKCIKHSGGLCG